jgi:hypothetical protein
LDISYNKFSRNVSSSFHNLNVGLLMLWVKKKPSIEVVGSCFLFASNGTLEILIVYICNDGILSDNFFNSGYSKTFQHLKHPYVFKHIKVWVWNEYFQFRSVKG